MRKDPNPTSDASHSQPDRLLIELREILARNRLIENLVHRQEMPHHDLVEGLVHRQNMARLAARLDELHPADIARILEQLPLDERMIVWELVAADRDGEVLIEASEAVRDSLIRAMEPAELVAAAGQLGADELADLASALPEDVIQDVFSALPHEERERVRVAMSYPDDTVGALMDFDLVSIRPDVSLEVAQRYLRRLKVLPDHTDKLFVVDRETTLLGVLPLTRLLLNEPSDLVGDAMSREIISLRPDEPGRDAAAAFERYDLVSAPVVDAQRHLIGRVAVDAVVDHIRELSDSEQLSNAGLREDEDLFAPVWKSLKNRAPWLMINLLTALLASRVIGLFERSIEQIVALAVLMPIVAGMGGNIGNQTITMIVRVLAMRPLKGSDIRKLYYKEMALALINGLVWGGALGLLTLALYREPGLSVVIGLAMTLNFLLAAAMGVSVPLLRQRMGRDPALGASVMITAITDSGGFLIFLGLATLLLL